MKRYLVYFFGTDTDEVKIGYTGSNLYERKTQIQVGCPKPITLLGVILCRNKSEMIKREKDIHRKFKAYKTVGEWFKNASEILSYLEEFIVSGQDILEESGFNNTGRMILSIVKMNVNANVNSIRMILTFVKVKRNINVNSIRMILSIVKMNVNANVNSIRMILTFVKVNVNAPVNINRENVRRNSVLFRLNNLLLTSLNTRKRITLFRDDVLYGGILKW